MTDFNASYVLSRGRFLECIAPFSSKQLNFRLHPGSLTIGEMALHLAGAELWFISQITGRELSAEETKLTKCATEGVVNDNPFPYIASEITPEKLNWALTLSGSAVQPHIENPSQEFLDSELVSALGPVIKGHGALARMAFHAAYHHGQAYLMQTAPGFPQQ
jgi:hypothetical protein